MCRGVRSSLAQFLLVGADGDVDGAGDHQRDGEFAEWSGEAPDREREDGQDQEPVQQLGVRHGSSLISSFRAI